MSEPVRIAVIDSGVHATHPHVNGVAGGISITPDGREQPDYVDRLGHGTAVTAAIREKAPEADVFAVKIFHDALGCSIECLVAAIEWSIRSNMDLINLSLGTSKQEHAAALQSAVDRARENGALIVAAHEDGGVRWLPGSLPGVVPVALDWDCPRNEYRTATLADGRTVLRASGYPRPIPGVTPARNLSGISFAVANVTGLLARELHAGSLLRTELASRSK
jgi:subtilisin family serine protease